MDCFSRGNFFRKNKCVNRSNDREKTEKMHENDDMLEKLPSKAEIGGFVVKQLLQITKF
jgi:hypothetical protein